MHGTLANRASARSLGDWEVGPKEEKTREWDMGKETAGKRLGCGGGHGSHSQEKLSRRIIQEHVAGAGG